MVDNDNPNKIPPRFWLIIALSGAVFCLAIIPVIFHIREVAYYYCALIFSVFLGCSTSILYLVNPRNETRGVELDYRVIHFALRLSLAFGIGAILVAALFLCYIFGVIIK